MEIIFDIVVILVILLSTYAGYKKGLVNVGFNLFAVIISLVVSALLYSPVTQFVIENTDVDERIEAIIIKNGTDEKVEESADNTIGANIQAYAENMAQDVQNAAVKSTARTIAINIVGICVMILLFILARVILTVLKIFTNIVTKIPIIKQCNELAGIAYGILRGLIIVYIVLAIVYYSVPLSGDEWINVAIDKSYVTKFFYENNVIVNFLQKGLDL